MFWFQLYVLLNVFIVVVLALNVSRLRIQEKVANGDGGKLVLKQAIRSHMNGVEHSLPFALVILALALKPEFNQSAWMGILVIGFTVSRLAHAVSVLSSAFGLRRLAATGTYLFEVAGLLLLAFNL